MTENERAAINLFLITRFRDLDYMYRSSAEADRTEAILEKIKGWDEWRELDVESKNFLKKALGTDFKEVHLANLLGDMTRQKLDEYSSKLRRASKSDIDSGRCCLHCKHFCKKIDTSRNKALTNNCILNKKSNIFIDPDDRDTAEIMGIYHRDQGMVCDYFEYAEPV